MKITLSEVVGLLSSVFLVTIFFFHSELWLDSIGNLLSIQGCIWRKRYWDDGISALIGIETVIIRSKYLDGSIWRVRYLDRGVPVKGLSWQICIYPDMIHVFLDREIIPNRDIKIGVSEYWYLDRGVSEYFYRVEVYVTPSTTFNVHRWRPVCKQLRCNWESNF